MSHEIVLLGITAVQIVSATALYFAIVDDMRRYHHWLKPAMAFFVLLDIIAMYLILGNLPSDYFT